MAVIHRSLTTKSQPEDLEELSQGFTGYAAKNWMIHFYFGQELVDEDLTDSGRSLFRTDKSPISRWLTVYEEATAERLPRHEIFRPFSAVLTSIYFLRLGRPLK